jgi:hypothetical protein
MRLVNIFNIFIFKQCSKISTFIPRDWLRINPSTPLPLSHPPSTILDAAGKDRAADGDSGISSHCATGLGEGLLSP